MSDWPIKRWSFFISIKKIATSNLPKTLSCPNMCCALKRNKKHGAQSYQLQVQQVQVSQRKASLFVPLTSKWKWRQSRMSDWPIKPWSFFISIKKIATSNFPKTLICPNMCCAQKKKQEARSTVISAASPASASEPTESILICASDKQAKITSVKNIRLTYQALEFLHQHQEDSNFKSPKNTQLPKHVLCTKKETRSTEHSHISCKSSKCKWANGKHLYLCLWQASENDVSQECQTDLSSVGVSSSASRR